MANPEWDNYDVPQQQWERRLHVFLADIRDSQRRGSLIRKDAQWLLDNEPHKRLNRRREHNASA